MVRSNLTPIIIAGPTGSGKSGLAMRLARKFHGEIICADSRQFYKYMSIGTASPNSQDLAQITHHGYNTVDPRTTQVDIGWFLDFAHKTMREIASRGHRAIIVGGTGLYLRSLRYGISDVPKANPEVIKILEQECETWGLAHLYAQLNTHDPITAQKVSPNDKFRIMRALDILRTTGQAPSQLRKSFANKTPKFTAHWILRNPPKEILIKNLSERIEHMFSSGLLEEASKLKKMLTPDHWALQVMGFHESLLYLDHKITLEQAKNLILIRHRQYAKRQITWFNSEKFYKYNISKIIS